jgi:alpha-amylase/alpha-mannosidase (GH57 family)
MTGNEINGTGKYIVIHGHFYQPPRENPWINCIEVQPSAAPSHNWNERIYDQCYRPNAYSRLLDKNFMISSIENNYQHMSFNFGPTLFSWLEQFHPSTAKRIIDADRESCLKFNGHGNAVAQVFNHIIMPLSSRRDQLTQIRWAKSFFRRRFLRDPEGIWLAETAINMETVQCLIDEKIKFVILSPNQAESFRSMDNPDAQWISTQYGFDTRRPYRLFPRNQAGKKLPGHLDIFFFDEGLSKEVSFGNMLTDAHIFGSRINACYSNPANNEVVVLATDGETFGHHKPFGDMCLAFYFSRLASESGVTPVNFAYYLSLFPPKWEVSLKNVHGEGTAWSCAHGVGRWIRDCGCKTGGNDSWRQTWRSPLRSALENLQEAVDEEFEKTFASFDCDPWKIRDEYISIFGTVPFTKVKKFFEKQLQCALTREMVYTFRRALEAQKFMLYSFTSCGWFFSEISGLETMQNLSYACRALQLGIAEDNQHQIYEKLLSDLEPAHSNIGNQNGKTLFLKYIAPFNQHHKILAFTAAVLRTLDIKAGNSFQLFNHSVTLGCVSNDRHDGIDYSCYTVHIHSIDTGEEFDLVVCLSHQGYLDLTGWVLKSDKMPSEKNVKFIDWVIEHSESVKYGFNDLFDTSRRDLENHLLKKIANDTGMRFGSWMKKNLSEINLLAFLDSSLPTYCAAPLSFVINRQWDTLITSFKDRNDDDALFTDLLDLQRNASKYGVVLDQKNSAIYLERTLFNELQSLTQNIEGEKCDRVRFLLNIVDRFSIPVSKNKLEDLFMPFLKTKVRDLYNGYQLNVQADADDEQLRETKFLVLKLISFARRMNFNTDEFPIA